MSVHKTRRKVEICHNCHTILRPEDNFCPHCGQENHDLKVPLGHILFEVFEGFTHFDTKFYNTMHSIFLYPGKITKDFLEGRRGRYVPPIRLYFLVSFLFFLFLNKMVDLAIKNSDGFLAGFVDGAKDKKTNTTDTQELKEELAEAKTALDNSSDSTEKLTAQANYTKLKKELSNQKLLNQKNTKKVKQAWITLTEDDANDVLDEMNIAQNDTLRALLGKQSAYNQREKLLSIQKQIALDSINTATIEEVSDEIRSYFTETIGRNKQLEYTLNLHTLKNNTALKIQYDKDTIITIHGSDGSLQNMAYKRNLLKMSDEQLDSLISKTPKSNVQFWGLSALRRGFARNITTYELAFSEDAEKAIAEITHFGIEVFSVMMFILMPIVALLLKIIYSQRSHSVFSYPFRLIVYLWDLLLSLVKIRKKRKHTQIPHILEGNTRYYYEHLIFSIHIHSVFFLMLIIFVGTGIFLGHPQIATSVTMVGFFFYFIISLKTVYRQGIIKTLFKSMILFFLYVISFIIILSVTGSVKFAFS